jgi:hypothetical protein
MTLLNIPSFRFNTDGEELEISFRTLSWPRAFCHGLKNTITGKLS